MNAPSLEKLRWLRTEFHALFDLSETERAARLDRIGQDDEELADELRRLLDRADADRQAEMAASRLEADHGTLVGAGFRLLRRIGMGGMGEVFLAEHTGDVHKQVALKLVRSDLPVPVARAMRERQILARLDHPNIAGLIDAGLTPAGQPWFAMEYVDGEPITAWCDEHKLDLFARVELFEQVCAAVQFAHRNLILHRDLKPSNILISREGVPKLLDFGIAKMLDSTDPQQTQTLALTPAYASPEQLRGESATTSSDIYQLGLVLYELLSGVSAREAKGTRARLPRPDHATATLRNPADAVRVAQARGLRPERLRRMLAGDLGRIVIRATAVEAGERYETAQALADDLHRWAAGRPVQAHQGSFAYRTFKLVRRHMVASVSIAVLALGLIATSIVAMHRAASERLQREHAEEQRRRAETLLDFMRQIFQQAEPANAGSAALTATQLLDRAAAGLALRSDLDVVTKAILTKQVADTYLWIGESAKSLDLARTAHAALLPVRSANSAEYLASVTSLMNALYVSGDFQGVVDGANEALPFAGGIRDDASWHARLLRDRGGAYCRLRQSVACENDLREAMGEFERAGPAAERDLAQTVNNLAVLLDERGSAAEALALFRRAERLVAESPDPLEVTTLILRYNIAKELYNLGHVDEAIGSVEPIPPRFDVLGGPDRVYGVLGMQRLLARAYSARGEGGRARALADRVVERARGLREDRAFDLAQSLMIRAKVALDTHDAVAALSNARAAESSLHDADRLSGMLSIKARWIVGEALLQSGRHEEASALFAKLDSEVQPLIGDSASWVRAEIEDSRGRCEMANRNYAAAISRFDDAVNRYVAALGEQAASTLRSRIHGLWARSMDTGDDALLAEIRHERDALASILGGEDRPAIRDADELIAAIARQSQHRGNGSQAAANRDTASEDGEQPGAGGIGSLL